MRGTWCERRSGQSREGEYGGQGCRRDRHQLEGELQRRHNRKANRWQCCQPPIFSPDICTKSRSNPKCLHKSLHQTNPKRRVFATKRALVELQLGHVIIGMIPATPSMHLTIKDCQHSLKSFFSVAESACLRCLSSASD